VTKTLKLAAALSLPLEAVTEKLAFLGRTGSGKTYAAQKLAEEMTAVGAQFVALDPVGKWYSLRLAADGKSAGIEVPIFGGLNGDVPLESTAGKMMADLIADRGISAVLDVSQFESDAAKNRFAKDFAERFFFRKKAAPSAVHLFLEEGQEFVPQNTMGDGDKLVLHAFTRIWKLGRNYGIGGSIITQRPQEVNKKLLNLTEVLFAFQLTGPHERKSVAEWIKEKGLDIDVEALLPKLKPGHPHVWSPALLDISKEVAIGKKWTFDASSTPKVGAKAQTQTLAPIDLEKIRKDMAATIERAKADDPKELRKQIAELRSALNLRVTAEKHSTPAKVETKVVEKAVLKDGQLARLAKVVEQLGALAERGATMVGEARGIAGDIVVAVRQVNAAEKRPGIPTGPRVPYRETASPQPKPANRSVSVNNNGDNSPLTGAKLKIVRALAELEAIGESQPTRAQLGFYVGMTFSGGYGSNTLGAMRTEALIDYPGDGRIALTDTGRAAGGEVDPPASLDELHARVRRNVTGLQERIFDALVVLGRGGSVTREELGELTNATYSGGYGSNTLGALHTAGIITYPTKGSVGPSDLLFPEGLA
jgi:hypothetical protein